MVSNDEPIGVIHAVSRPIVERAATGKTILAKYVPRVPSKRSKYRLRPGMKLYFYLSDSGQQVVAEARIEGIEFARPEEFDGRTWGAMVLTREEFRTYSRGRDRALLLIHFSRFERYSKPRTLSVPLTMNGMYVYDSNYESLFGE